MSLLVVNTFLCEDYTRTLWNVTVNTLMMQHFRLFVPYLCSFEMKRYQLMVFTQNGKGVQVDVGLPNSFCRLLRKAYSDERGPRIDRADAGS